MDKMTVADKLSANKFVVDDENAHITVDKQYADAGEADRVMRICPAELYRKGRDGIDFDYLGCLECGTCRVLSAGKVVTGWKYPEGSFGVCFRCS